MRFWRVIWGFLFGLAFLWACPALIMGGPPLMLCTGILPALLFGLLYWRNGVGLRNARQHRELLEALRK